MPAAAKRTPEEEEAIERRFLEADAPPAEEPPADDEAPVEEVTFRAKGVNFRAVMVPRQRWTAPNGEVQVSDGVTYEFAPKGEFRTDDPEAIAYLRGLGSFNREFWEVGNEPGRIPDSGPMIERVAAASAALNLEALDELELEERAGHKRHDVLTHITASKVAVKKMLEAQAG